MEQIFRYQKKYRVASHVIFWLGVLLLGVSDSRYHDGREFTWWLAFTADGLFLFPSILAAYFLTNGVIPALYSRRQFVAASLVFLAGSYAICVLGRFFIVRIAEPLAGIAPKAFETNMEILTDLPKLLYVYFFPLFSISLVFLFIKLLIQHQTIQRRAILLEKEKIETELKLLKSQLNPHFLFNTLNNIYALSLLNSPATSPAIGKLAEILDHILYRCDGDLVPLSGEIALLDNYLSLEKLRYDDRLLLRFTRRVECEAAVPPLLLLSLAENAFKHGASQDMGRPVIEIELEVDPERLRFCVANSVVLPPAMDRPGKIGLTSLRKQLDLLYAGRHVFTTGYTEDQFQASIVIDLRKGNP